MHDQIVEMIVSVMFSFPREFYGANVRRAGKFLSDVERNAVSNDGKFSRRRSPEALLLTPIQSKSYV